MLQDTVSSASHSSHGGKRDMLFLRKYFKYIKYIFSSKNFHFYLPQISMYPELTALFGGLAGGDMPGNF